MTEQPRCVVIDDDTEFLQQVKRFFAATHAEFEVHCFSRTIDAVDFIRRERVNLIITAYLVPQIDGLQLISLVRAFNAEVPILMLSNVPVRAAALARGATGFLSKADLWTHLETVIPQLCGRSAANDEGVGENEAGVAAA